MEKQITTSFLNKLNKDFKKEKSNSIAMNAATANGIGKAAENVLAKSNNQFGFSVEVDAGKVCNQKRSGRCWMFAAYNVMRLEIMKKLNIENMELSQAYPLFYDKLEKANFFLENIIETKDEPLNGRVVAFLLTDPVGDGGQWDMFRSLVAKYGVVPKEVMPETENSSNTYDLDTYLTTKLREFACTLRKMNESGKSVDEMRNTKENMMTTIHRMLCIALGTPPQKFTWETRDKDKNFIRVSNITPQDFFKEYIGWDLDDYITIINAPTKDKPYGKTYTVQYLGSVYDGAYPVKYLNLPMDDLRDIAIKQLKDGNAVWFGSDVGQFSNRKAGFLTMDALNVADLFNTTFSMTKEERLDYGESMMTHAMVITGVDLDENDKPIRWKVENSWGEDVGKKGFYVMDDAWFGEFAFQILLNRKYMTEKQKKAFEAKPIMLKPWDPMGSLAKGF